MATTYRAAFGNPHAQNSVATSLGIGRPDTSCDAALAKALEEEERDMAAAAAAHPQRAASPSGIRLHVSMEESRADSQRRSTHDGTPAHPVKPAAGQQNGTARLQLSDAELARQLQRVELASAADAAGTTPSMLYPELLGMRSSRELTLDRSLSRAHSVRANPRVVAASVPPSEPVVSADRQRLLTTLRQYDLVEREVQGDGNCQFRALSDQLYGSPEHHAAVRAAVVAVLRQRASSYSCYVPEEYGKYCSSMAKSGTWGDHVTLQAAADHYGLRITVVTSFGESPVIYIDPADKRSPRTLYLSFWAEVHYNSLYPAQEPPPPVRAPPEPVPGKPPKVLGSRTLGRVVKEVEKGFEVVTEPISGLLGYRTSA